MPKARCSVIPIAIPTDNYAFIVSDGFAAVVVDPSTAAPISDELGRDTLTLRAILLTHHHGDHCAGAPALKASTDCTVLAADDPRIPVVDRTLGDGERFDLLGLEWQALAVPGHTRSHLAFHCPAIKALFTGDTLFAGGCGRIFEGTASQMWASLQRLAALPADTHVFFGHEYTEENLAFALSILPDDETLQSRLRSASDRVYKGFTTVPSTLAVEKATNIFLRSGEPAVKTALDMAGRPDAEVFGELRRRKDWF
jgi:hydroxyacylglutathione hydrolase